MEVEIILLHRYRWTKGEKNEQKNIVIKNQNVKKHVITKNNILYKYLNIYIKYENKKGVFTLQINNYSNYYLLFIFFLCSCFYLLLHNFLDNFLWFFNYYWCWLGWFNDRFFFILFLIIGFFYNC